MGLTELIFRKLDIEEFYRDRQPFNFLFQFDNFNEHLTLTYIHFCIKR